MYEQDNTKGSSDSSDAKSPDPCLEALSHQSRQTEKPADRRETVTYRGQVLDAEGRPLPAAALYVNTHEFQHLYHSPVRTTSGPDGRFQFAVPKSDFDASYWDAPWRGTRAPVLPRAAGYAFGLTNYQNDFRGVDLTACA